jgi:hypothetical protein
VAVSIIPGRFQCQQFAVSINENIHDICHFSNEIFLAESIFNGFERFLPLAGNVQDRLQ